MTVQTMNEAAFNEIELSPHDQLRIVNEVESETALEELVEKQINPIIKHLLRSKLHVSLQTTDERQLNQDALEMLSEVKVAIISQLSTLETAAPEKLIEDLSAYVRAATLNVYHQYLRRKHPQRLRLKNQLRYLLTHHPELALWETDKRVSACGFRKWQKRNTVLAKVVFSEELAEAVADSNFMRKPLIGRLQATNLVLAIFDHLQISVIFEDLVTIVGEIQGLREPSEVEITKYLVETKSGKTKDILSRLEQTENLQKLWDAICGLPLRHRNALLLNLKDGSGESLIGFLPILRIASISKIGEILGFSIEDFSVIWNELPWDDLKIAGYLGLTRQQVINLRQSSRTALRRKMKDS